MFPLHRIHHFASDLLELADALLSPGAERLTDAADDVVNPHRRPVQIARRRRPGDATPRCQHCTSPVPQRAHAVARATSH